MNLVQAGLEVLVGEGEGVLEMVAATCETRSQWELVLERPLEGACLSGNTRLVTKLVLAGARVTRKSFLLAATRCRWDTLLGLLSLTRKGDLEQFSLLKPLRIAIKKGQTRVVRAILEASGAGFFLRRTLIVAVRDAGDAAEEIVRVLLNHPGAPKVIDWFGLGCDNPLLIASRRGLSGICSMLLDKGADVNAQHISGKANPLYNAVVISGDLRTVQVLLRAGAHANVPCGVDGRTVVHTACQLGDSRAEVLEALIKHGADVKAVDVRNITPLHLASGVAPPCDDTIRLLLHAGADVNARKHNGCTPLHSASRYLRTDAARALLRHGADETIITKNSGYTPLEVVGMRLAITSPGDIDTMRGLLIGAPAERAWRRRSCIVLCRALCASNVATPSSKQVRRVYQIVRRSQDRSFRAIVHAASDDVFHKIVGYL